MKNNFSFFFFLSHHIRRKQISIENVKIDCRVNLDMAPIIKLCVFGKR